MEITLSLMILELLICTGSFICSILQVKTKKHNKKRSSKRRNKRAPKNKIYRR